jgi:hypothetical protein
MGFMMGFSAQGDERTVGMAPAFPSNSEETMTPNEGSPRKRRLSGIFVVVTKLNDYPVGAVLVTEPAGAVKPV